MFNRSHFIATNVVALKTVIAMATFMLTQSHNITNLVVSNNLVVFMPTSITWLLFATVLF